jgi:LuxR family maltose regulon positive regulatory protein
MCAELCDVVTESAESQITLESMHRSKLFLIPMDRNGLWYRYHHLFGEFLQTELRKSDPDRYRKTCDIAALWCEGNGQTTEAIQYALDGGNFACATELITRYALELSQKKGDHFTILEWMRRLPVAHQNSRPEILLSHAWSLAFSRHDQPARALVEQAMDKIADRDVNPWHLSPAERIRWSQIARVTLAVVNAASDQLESCLEASLTLSDELPEDDAFSRASVGNCLAYCHFAKREFSTCAVAASNAQLQGQRAGAEFATGWACFLLGLSELELGRLASTNEQSERLERCAKGSPVRYLSDLSNLLKAEIASHTGDFDRAADLADRGKSFPDFFGAVEPMFLAIRGQARAMEWAGDVGAALRTLLQGKDLALKLQKPRLHNLLTIEEVGLRLNSGDASGASVALERHGLQEKSEKSTHDTDRRFQILEIRRMLAGNRTKEAHSLLRNLQKNAGYVAPCLSDLIAIHSLKSVALWIDGKNMEAARELDCAFALVKDGASLYWLYQMGTELQPLLEFLKNHRGESPRKKTAETDNHIETVLLDLIARKCSRPKEAQGGVSDSKAEHINLTKKERRVIALIENGMSNEQIAKELFVSEATVKWHLHNVYSKLDVKSRTAAVAQARKLALL